MLIKISTNYAKFAYNWEITLTNYAKLIVMHRISELGIDMLLSISSTYYSLIRSQYYWPSKLLEALITLKSSVTARFLSLLVFSIRHLNG